MLKILAIHHGSFAPLKACPSCMSEAATTSRSSFWRCEHQTPGVYFCQIHGTMLRVLNASGHHRARIEFLLPHMLSPLDWHQTPTLSEQATCRLHAFTMWSNSLRTTSGLSCTPFDLAVLRDTLHIKAKEKGWVGIDGSLEFKKIRRAVGAAHQELFSVPGLEFLSGSQKEGGGYVSSLMHQQISTYAHHPLTYVALLGFFFDSVDEFFGRYKVTSETSPEDRRSMLMRERNSVSELLVRLVSNDGMSVNQAAKFVGVQPSRALVYLKEKGIKWQKRSRIVGGPLEPKLIERLELGDAPAEIALELELRRSFIKNYLASRPDLRSRHASARLHRQRQEYRQKFLKILDNNPLLPLKRIRREMNSGFEWLYRNDRDWLICTLPGIWHR